MIGFFSERDVSVRGEDGGVVVSIGDERRELTRAEAAALRAAIGEAVSQRREFVRTAGVHRPDGSYAVERRGADSAGNAQVFDSFGAVTALYDRLPETIDAGAVGREGITGSRRHLLVRHFAEHPAFDCRIECRSPLRVEKRSPRADPGGARADGDPGEDLADDERGEGLADDERGDDDPDLGSGSDEPLIAGSAAGDP